MLFNLTYADKTRFTSRHETRYATGHLRLGPLHSQPPRCSERMVFLNETFRYDKSLAWTLLHLLSQKLMSDYLSCSKQKSVRVCYIMCLFHADPGALYKSRIKCLGMRMLASLATELAVGGQELIRAYSTSCESCYLRTNTLRLVFAPRTEKGHMGCTITWLFTLRMRFYPLPRSATALFYPHATKHM